MAEAGQTEEDLNWLSDYVVAVLKSPTWVTPLAQFVDEQCYIFDDDSEESLHEHKRCHDDFRQMVSDLFSAHLMEVSLTDEQFQRFCEHGLSQHQQLHRALAEQLLAVEDFLTFKAMMTKQNADLCREVVGFDHDEADVGGWSAPTSPNSLVQMAVKNSVEEGLKAIDDEWELYETTLLGSTAGFSRPEANQDMLEAAFRCEEAELEQAIALSLQIEEERLRQIEAGEEPESVAPQEEALEDVLASALVGEPSEAPPIQQLPGTAGFTSAPLMMLPKKPKAVSAPRMVHIEPLHLPSATSVTEPKVWGFTSAPLMSLPHRIPPPPPADDAAPAADAPAAPPVPPPAPPTSSIPSRAGFLSSPLCVVPPRPKVPEVDPVMSPMHVVMPEYTAPESSPVTEVDEMKSNLHLWKERAVRVMEPPKGTMPSTRARAMSTTSADCSPQGAAADLPPPPPAVSEEELDQRRAHLKQLRDRLIAKRNKDREQQMSEFHAGRSSASGVDEARFLSAQEKAAAGRRLIAELTPGAVPVTAGSPRLHDPEAASQKMRHMLTLQLRQGLMRSMTNNAGVLDQQLSQLESMRACHRM
eukprot:TRINITY_DN25348_c0_g1_i1.p1 TRINITY_DN25348_c0_g1~~TRINITY_DN25348_c0_g1_i1.p1  ORF type:complete len:585 (+),score=145.51 TRINITY_DN25348_c0_g1_i1:72-1826(+)